MREKLTAERLREILDYEAATGIFRWKMSPSRKIKVGDVAGGPKPHGYMKIQIFGTRYYSHRLAWLYVTGSWPKGRLDHKDGYGIDNSFLNLREATRQQNAINRPAKGTRFHLGLGRWTAQIGFNRKSVYLGAFDSEQAAHDAYLRAVVKFHGEEWLTRKAA